MLRRIRVPAALPVALVLLVCCSVSTVAAAVGINHDAAAAPAPPAPDYNKPSKTDAVVLVPSPKPPVVAAAPAAASKPGPNDAAIIERLLLANQLHYPYVDTFCSALAAQRTPPMPTIPTATAAECRANCTDPPEFPALPARFAPASDRCRKLFVHYAAGGASAPHPVHTLQMAERIVIVARADTAAKALAIRQPVAAPREGSAQLAAIDDAALAALYDGELFVNGSAAAAARCSAGVAASTAQPLCAVYFEAVRAYREQRSGAHAPNATVLALWQLATEWRFQDAAVETFCVLLKEELVGQLLVGVAGDWPHVTALAGDATACRKTCSASSAAVGVRPICTRIWAVHEAAADREDRKTDAYLVLTQAVPTVWRRTTAAAAATVVASRFV